MRLPLFVAVSQRVDTFPDRRERRDALDQKLCQWLVQFDCMPIPVPNNLAGASNSGVSKLHEWLQALKPGGVVLSGGNDIGDMPERDQTENLLLSYAQEYNLPVLGICRGMQMIGICAGGVLKPVDGHVRSRHKLQGNIVSDVNSFHSFALAECPPGFEVLARAEDGVIEAIRHVDLPWEGWMWHPERESSFSPYDVMRARHLFHG